MARPHLPVFLLFGTLLLSAAASGAGVSVGGHGGASEASHHLPAAAASSKSDAKSHHLPNATPIPESARLPSASSAAAAAALAAGGSVPEAQRHLPDFSQRGADYHLPSAPVQTAANTLPDPQAYYKRTAENTLPAGPGGADPQSPSEYAKTHLPLAKPWDGVPQTEAQTQCWFCASVVQNIDRGAPFLRNWCSMQGVNAGFCMWMTQEVGMKWNQFMANIHDPSDYRYRVYDFKFHMESICKNPCAEAGGAGGSAAGEGSGSGSAHH